MRLGDKIDRCIAAVPQLRILQLGEILGLVVAVGKQRAVRRRSRSDIEHPRSGGHASRLLRYPAIAIAQVEGEQIAGGEQAAQD